MGFLPRSASLILVAFSIAIPIGGAKDKVELQTTLKPADLRPGDAFGSSIVNFDNLIAVGAPKAPVDVKEGAGVVYLFEKDFVQQEWNEVAKLTASDPTEAAQFGQVYLYGQSVLVGAVGALSQSGNEYIQTGAAYIFERSDGSWTETAKLIGSNLTETAKFGASVAMYEQTIVVGAYCCGTGTVYIFQKIMVNGNLEWIETQVLAPNQTEDHAEFGRAVAIFGDILVVGSYREDWGEFNDAGAAYIYERNGDNIFIHSSRLMPSTFEENVGKGFRFGMGLSLYNSELVVGSVRVDHGNVSEVGGMFVFEKSQDGGSFNEVTKLTASDLGTNHRFGRTPSIYKDLLTVGAHGNSLQDSLSGAGAAYLFERTVDYELLLSLGIVSHSWEEVALLTAPDAAISDEFGRHTNVHGKTVVVGAPGKNVDGLVDAGCAYVFTINDLREFVYIGSYIVHDGENPNNSPKVLSCIEACQLIFGFESYELVHCSSVGTSIDSVDFEAHYTQYGVQACEGPMDEDFHSGPEYYNQSGAISALVNSGCHKSNFCFKEVINVPTPSTPAVYIPPQPAPSPGPNLPPGFEQEEEESDEESEVEDAPSDDGSGIVATISIACMTLLVFALFIWGHIRQPDAENAQILVSGLALMDFSSDVAFAIELAGDKHYLTTFAAIFLAFPASVNICVFLYLIQLEFRHKQVSIWFVSNSVGATVIMMLSFTNLDVVTLLYSRIFDQGVFDAPFTLRFKARMAWLGLVGNTFEDIPQLFIQVIVFATSETPSPIVLFSLATTSLTLIFGILRRVMYCMIFRGLTYISKADAKRQETDRRIYSAYNTTAEKIEMEEPTTGTGTDV